MKKLFLTAVVIFSFAELSYASLQKYDCVVSKNSKNHPKDFKKILKTSKVDIVKNGQSKIIFENSSAKAEVTPHPGTDEFYINLDKKTGNNKAVFQRSSSALVDDLANKVQLIDSNLGIAVSCKKIK